MDSVSIVFWSIIGLVSVIFLFFKKRYSYWKDRGVAFAEPTFPVGNLPFRQQHLKDTFNAIYKKKDGSPFMGAFMFTTPIVVTTHLDFIQSVLVKDFSSFAERGAYQNEKDDPMSAHMFSVEGEKWKSIRSKITPTFTSGKMKFTFPTVVEVANRFVDTLQNIVRSECELEFRDLLGRFTTDVIGTCAFGIECNSLKDPDSAFRYYGKKVFDEHIFNPITHMLVNRYPELARKLHVRAVHKDVSDFFMETVRDTIEYREKNNIRRNDFMDLMIQLKNGDFQDENSRKSGRLTLEEIAAQSYLFFIAGFETSSTALMYTLYELALNPDIQEKGRLEIDEVLGKHEGKLTYEAVQEMKYIDQILTEVLRKYPPGVVLFRKCVRDYKVPNSKATIVKGTEIFIPVYSIHHDPEIYPEPDVFDPERFSPEQTKNRHPMAFLGFGDGPRNCVGLRFGKMQSRIGLIHLLKHFRFSTSPKTPIPLIYSYRNPILTPEGGMYLKCVKI